ncbi:MAG: helix-turn-helix domain-containing protein [Synergistales bacterium]|nr:helix-turn-helix domain-containing protein [Synergistales bacterium]
MLDKFAQQIADSTEEVIGYHVLLTDRDGVVVGSSERERVGGSHQPSLQVIARQEELYTDPETARDMEGVKPGVTLPIRLAGAVVGSIALAGTYGEVAQYGHLVQRHAEIYLRERVLAESAAFRERALAEMLQEIASFNPAERDVSLLVTRGHELGFDLTRPRIALVVAVDNIGDLAPGSFRLGAPAENEVQQQALRRELQQRIRSVFPNRQDLLCAGGEGEFALLHLLPRRFRVERFLEDLMERCRGLHTQLTGRSCVAYIGIGTIAYRPEELRRSYHSAWKALSLGRRERQHPGVYNIDSFLFEDLISTVNRETCRHFIDQVLIPLRRQNDWDDLAQTFLAWCDAPCRPGEVAAALNIHRNTLAYRLDKIQRISGIDPRSFRQATLLYLAIRLHRLTGGEPGAAEPRNDR